MRGRRSRWREGAVIGFFPGAIFMGLAVVGLDECTHDCDHTGPVMAYGLAGGLVTGTVGALIGLAVKTDRWTEVSTGRPKTAFSLRPAKGGFRAGVSLTF